METTATESKSDAPEEKVLDLNTALEILDSYPRSRRYLIPMLQKIQKAYRFLPEPIIEMVIERLRLKKAQVYGVISFYPQLMITEPGKYILKLCVGTACFVKGSTIIADKIHDKYHIREGQTDARKLYTLQTASCMGNCGAAPILLVGEDFYGNVDPEQTLPMLEPYETK